SFIFSFFPLLLLAASSASFFGHGEHTVESVSTALSRFMPAESHDLIQSYVNSLFASGPRSGLFSISLLLLLWTGSSLISTLMKSVNRAYHIPPDRLRPYWKEKLVAIVLVPITFLPIVLASIAAIIGSRAAAFVGTEIGFDIEASDLWALTEWALIVLVLFVIISLLYYVSPCKKLRIKEVLPGAILASVLWAIITVGFNYYVGRFGSYNRIYGSIGAFIVLLLWMYLTSLAFIIGGEFNAVLEENP